MIDFKKLNDPEWQAKAKASQEAWQAEFDARQAKLKRAVELCRDHIDELTSDERSLVRACTYRLATSDISDKQEAWLMSIAKRFEGATR